MCVCAACLPEADVDDDVDVDVDKSTCCRRRRCANRQRPKWYGSWWYNDDDVERARDCSTTLYILYGTYIENICRTHTCTHSHM